MLVIIVLIVLFIIVITNNKRFSWEKCLFLLVPKKLRSALSVKLEQTLFHLKTFQKSVLLKASLLSIIAILLILLRSYFLALSLDIKMTFITLSACLSVVALIQMIPITIFGVGTRDLTLIYLFPLLGFSNEAALSFSFLLLVFVLMHSFLGLILWLKFPHTVQKNK